MINIAKIKDFLRCAVCLVALLVGYVVCVAASITGFVLTPLIEAFKGGLEEGRTYWGFDQ